MPVKEKKKQTLAEALDDINKTLGPGTILRMSEDPEVEVNVIPTGILPLDLALGRRRGLPRGRIIEAYGPQSCGKSTLALQVAAQAQQMGETCFYLDAEHALDPEYAEALGVDMDSLLLSQPDTGEQGFEIIERVVRTGEVAMVVIDSVASLAPRSEIEGDYGDSNVGAHGRLWSQSMRKLVGIFAKTDTMFFLINQLREAIGNPYVNEYTPGGKAIPFYASVRLDIRRIETITTGDKESKEAVSNRTRVKVIKNKTGKPHTQAVFDLDYGLGVTREGWILDLGIDYGVITQKGSWFATADGEQIGQGRQNAKTHLRENPEFADKLEAEIRKAIDA